MFQKCQTQDEANFNLIIEIEMKVWWHISSLHANYFSIHCVNVNTQDIYVNMQGIYENMQDKN